ncbi:hypothetical protein QTP88_009575 [Uroleucon formosanum]
MSATIKTAVYTVEELRAGNQTTLCADYDNNVQSDPPLRAPIQVVLITKRFNEEIDIRLISSFGFLRSRQLYSFNYIHHTSRSRHDFTAGAVISTNRGNTLS